MVGFLITQQSNIYIEIDLLLAGFGNCTIWSFPLALWTIFLLKIRREWEINESESKSGQIQQLRGSLSGGISGRRGEDEKVGRRGENERGGKEQ